MRRGTTPTLQITVTGLTDIEVQNLYLTLRQGQTTTLTQEETLSLVAKVDVALQLRVLSTNNTAYASNIVTVPVEAILKEGVIPDGGA